MKIKVFMIGVISLISLHAYSGDHSISSVCNLQSDEDGRVYLQPCEGWTSKNNCPTGIWVTWNGGTAGGKLMYSTALTALTANKKVIVRKDGSSCQGYDVVNMIRISKN
ncbi:hypothetical protein [Vibrio parahaemolyticus]|uniref:hypothetical protein n=1 Tax=Vibrio parahaemolyticus TaxID=670 RepID=UPI0004705F19|nr:hypothetical protein [Vibrio parahaemolyticus]MDF5406035.1 hypothetical protein [Vibrio parahaemolyticus]MDG2821532.1 hypothetical protein [Vibrio parahaemolyticus]MDG2844677.1 hypothetical protein [Vibrio parahaemolyticus]MDG2856825.1 hypothetical protein [Vibrio parahaemolyticus]MDG2865556.1 hypothetical protein [Vibrio parahaemolyticus]